MADVSATSSATFAKAASKKSKHRPIQDLREWLSQVESFGELVRVMEPVSRDEEMSAIIYLVAKKQPSPAVLFETVRGFEKSPIKAKLLWNILGPSIKRIALTLEEPPNTPTVELIQRVKNKLKNRIPPREVATEKAPIYENSISYPFRGTGRWTVDATRVQAMR